MFIYKPLLAFNHDHKTNSMEELEKQIPVNKENKDLGKLKKSSKMYNPGLRALLSIKHFTATLDEDYTELLRMEDELNKLNLNAQLIIETNVLPETLVEWKVVKLKIDNAVVSINEVLTSAKEKVANKEKDGYPEFWKQLTIQVTELKNSSKIAINTGQKLLPESVHAQWENEFVKLETPLVESLVAYVESCRVLLQMIDRYTPEELDAITKIIAEHVPLDYTYEEAVEYQKDYYKALVNFKKEFKQEKNLWDKFLDILAGGTHQSPSERVMMERWLDGDKGDL